MLESLTAADHSIASEKMNYILLCVHSLVMGFRGGAGTQILGGPKRYKIIDLPVGQISDPLSGKQYSLLFLQQLSSLGPLKGFLS